MDKDVLLYWSGGKDSAMALYDLNNGERYRPHRVTKLLTTLTEGYDRISGHGVRRTVLERQTEYLGLPLHKTYISKKASMGEYEYVIEEALKEHQRRGIEVVATGDIFVEKRRMAIFQKLGVNGCFPLMHANSRKHVLRFMDLGFKAYVVAVDSAALSQSFVGRTLDHEFVEELPFGVDPCGENGEFHTFVFDGPLFRKPMKCRLGEVVFRENLYFSDVLLDD